MKKLFGILFFGLMLASCSKEKAQNQIPQPMIIKSGEICGWCAKNDTLLLTPHQALLKTYKSCDSLSGQSSLNFSAAEWAQIRNKIDLQKFAALNLNSCAVCYDGCDKWITIQEGNSIHQIRFERGDTASVRSIEDFVNALDSLSALL